MSYCIRCFLLVCLSGFVLPTLASNTAIPSEKIVALAESDNWYRQLYLSNTEPGPSAPRIQDNQFYFSPGPIIDPLEELRATLGAFSSNTDSIDDNHPICRFPSRFIYLQRQLNLFPEVDILQQCPTFATWADLHPDSHVTVVMVDGYYGNPASSFGHLIVRIGRYSPGRALLDTSVTYGAETPEDEDILTYLTKGLIGGYLAGFTVEDFYHQDLIYTRTEFRDMWNYQLALSAEQKLQFTAHIWEVLGHPTTYYFVKNNCAFAVAEVLEFVLDTEIIDRDVHWYAPVTLFQELEQLDAKDPGHIIAQREFIPSKKRQLENLLYALNPVQARAVQQYLNTEGENLDELLLPLDATDAAITLEALLEYHDYLIRGYPELGTDLYDRRQQLLIARLALPPGQQLAVEPIEPGMPAGLTARTSRLSLGAAYRDDQLLTVLGFTPYQQSATDLGNDDLSELTALHTEIAFDDEHIDLNRFTFIRISQRSDWRRRLPEQRPISWDLGVAADCLIDCQSSEGIQLEGGLGQSLGLGPLLFSGLGRASLTGRELQTGFDLEVGLPEHFGWSVQSSVGYWLPVTDNAINGWLAQSDLRFSTSQKHSFLLSANLTDNDWQAQLNWQWHYR